jgi:hypothetical protein
VRTSRCAHSASLPPALCPVWLAPCWCKLLPDRSPLIRASAAHPRCV